MKRVKLWYLYFFLYLALGLYSIYNLIQLRLIFQLIRSTVLWFPAVLGIYLYIRGQKTASFRTRRNNGRSVFSSGESQAKACGASFISGRRKFPSLFWKLYFVYYLADIIYEWFWVRYYLSANAGMRPAFMNLVYILEVLFLLPSVVALYNISFRRE